MQVFHEILADRYLLFLADSQPSPAASDSLERCLLQAWRSRKPSVWVDCSRLHALAAAHYELLLRYHQRLRRRGQQLVLCQLSAPLQRAFEQLTDDLRPLLVPAPTAEGGALA
ncbi:STAS domain-containing protein [Hymenobacter sp. B81]|uniref:STAS domain-containing protein n=1 Tax=Hymenobacter sp. B81 TaxID=3344878 RepID=UPI0037DD1AC1